MKAADMKAADMKAAAEPQQGKLSSGASSISVPLPTPASVVPERPTQVIVPAGFTPVASRASTGSNQAGTTATQGQQANNGSPPQQGVTAINPAPQAPPPTVMQNAVQTPAPPATVIQNAVQQTQTTVNITPQFVLP
jgi:hypothetical protein